MKLAEMSGIWTQLSTAVFISGCISACASTASHGMIAAVSSAENDAKTPRRYASSDSPLIASAQKASPAAEIAAAWPIAR